MSATSVKIWPILEVEEHDGRALSAGQLRDGPKNIQINGTRRGSDVDLLLVPQP